MTDVFTRLKLISKGLCGINKIKVSTTYVQTYETVTVKAVFVLEDNCVRARPYAYYILLYFNHLYCSWRLLNTVIGACARTISRA
jgi:hypothetical protein